MPRSRSLWCLKIESASTTNCFKTMVLFSIAPLSTEDTLHLTGEKVQSAHLFQSPEFCPWERYVPRLPGMFILLHPSENGDHMHIIFSAHDSILSAYALPTPIHPVPHNQWGECLKATFRHRQASSRPCIPAQKIPVLNEQRQKDRMSFQPARVHHGQYSQYGYAQRNSDGGFGIDCMINVTNEMASTTKHNGRNQRARFTWPSFHSVVNLIVVLFDYDGSFAAAKYKES